MFNEEEDLENSKKYITESLTNKRELDSSLETSNITQYFVNITDVKDGIFKDTMAKGKNPYIADEHHTFLGTLADILCKKMRENGIDGKNFMLCNYIKFKHPNPSEDKIRKKSEETFARVMEENGYKDSYYEWFGYYPMMLYNCIAPPQYIDIIRTVISAGALRTMFKDDMKNQMKILAMTKPEFKNQKVLDLFKHIIPIKNIAHEIEPPPTAYGEDRKNNFCYSVYDLIGE
jgi:cysteinyl-tRNA synthetase